MGTLFILVCFLLFNPSHAAIGYSQFGGPGEANCNCGARVAEWASGYETPELCGAQCTANANCKSFGVWIRGATVGYCALFDTVCTATCPDPTTATNGNVVFNPIGLAADDPAPGCHAIVKQTSGMYYLQSNANNAVIYTYCDFDLSNGPWMQVGHVHQSTSTPFLGQENAGGNPDQLGFSINANGFQFDAIYLTHNGVTDGSFQYKTLAATATYAVSTHRAYLQTDGKYSVLGLASKAMVCVGSTRNDCFNQNRGVASGCVSDGTGDCRNLQKSTNSGCGGWDSPGANDGDTTFTVDGGKLYFRTVGVDCVGSWGAYEACSVTCGMGFQVRTYAVAYAGTGGAACPAADGETQSSACTPVECPIHCEGDFTDYTVCSVSCGGGTQSRTYTYTTPAAHGGDTCPTVEGTTQSRECDTSICPCAFNLLTLNGASSSDTNCVAGGNVESGSFCNFEADGSTCFPLSCTNSEWCEEAGGDGLTEATAARGCHALSGPSGMYYLQARYGAAIVHTYCDFDTADGPWMQIAHLTRTDGTEGLGAAVKPGSQTSGGDPNALGFSIEADGFNFDRMYLTMNGKSNKVMFQLLRTHTFVQTDTTKQYEDVNNEWIILERNGHAYSCFGSSNTACTNQDRSLAYGAVSGGTGDCNKVNHQSSLTCGGWTDGDETWTTVGGKIFMRTVPVCSVSGPTCVDNCAGVWGDYDSCSASCEAGTHTRTYTVTTPAGVGGAPCSIQEGSTETAVCNLGECPVHCEGGFGPWSDCSVTCHAGAQTRTYGYTTEAAHGGDACPITAGTTETQACDTGLPCPCAYDSLTLGSAVGSGAGCAAGSSVAHGASCQFEADGSTCFPLTCTDTEWCEEAGGDGLSEATPARGCHALSGPSGLYYLQARYGAAVVHTYCDFDTADGPWMQIAHLTRTDGTEGLGAAVWPGSQTSGGDPNALGFSIEADGFKFDRMYLTHNDKSNKAMFELSQTYTFVKASRNKFYMDVNGRWIILENESMDNFGHIPMACFGATDVDCQHQSRSSTYGAVSSASGNCNQVNQASDSGCGGWTDGDKTWTTVGGKIFMRTVPVCSVSGPTCVDNCAGVWGDYDSCSASCEAGTHTRTYTVTTPAGVGGAPCSIQGGSTETAVCNLGECPCTLR
eukprot:TRINITY_DN10480_c0_g1_i2.p1 TRINITY_DN10480_c0_g1~~TRINITY_DN10480_c0_g1_i2.p1  ORF type:complete len:1157 (+),score=247.08 TRINITY_DN10480_c0_g1_i2:56-3472(+)